MLLVHAQVVHSTAASFSDLRLPHGNIAPTPCGFVSACCCRYHVGSACRIEEMDQTLGWTACIRVLISEILDAGGYNPMLGFFCLLSDRKWNSLLDCETRGLEILFKVIIWYWTLHIYVISVAIFVAEVKQIGISNIFWPIPDAVCWL